MTAIGNLSIIHSETLLLPTGQFAKIDVSAAGRKYIFHIMFDDSMDTQSVLATERQDGAQIIFNKWINELPAAFKAPLEVRKIDNGGRILLMASSTRTGTINVLHVNFLTDGATI